MKKNKRGFLLAEETLKIIIAVIAISFLIYFLTSLYLKNQESKGLELAKASLENLISSIDLGEVLIYNPEGWFIISFPYSNERPNSCLNLGWENCLCICKDKWFSGRPNDCDKAGRCMESDLKVLNDEIKIENPPIKILINKKGEITK